MDKLTISRTGNIFINQEQITWPLAISTEITPENRPKVTLVFEVDRIESEYDFMGRGGRGDENNGDQTFKVR